MTEPSFDEVRIIISEFIVLAVPEDFPDARTFAVKVKYVTDDRWVIDRWDSPSFPDYEQALEFATRLAFGVTVLGNTAADVRQYWTGAPAYGGDFVQNCEICGGERYLIFHPRLLKSVCRECGTREAGF